MKLVALILLLCITSLSNAENDMSLDGDWNVTIFNLNGKPVTNMTIQFKDEEANSCLGGYWKKANVISHSTEDKDFFPIGDSVSYELAEGRIVIGHNEVCDAYLHLDAIFNGHESSGEYVSLGWGVKKLGTFTLVRSCSNDS